MTIARGLSGVLLLLGVACRPADNPQQAEQQTAAFKQAVATAERNYERFNAEGKADSLVTLYTENGRDLPPNEPAISGRAAIRDYQAKQMAVYQFNLKVTSEHATASGPIGIESGTFTMEGTPRKEAPAGTPVIKDDGKYLGHWHNVNGQWLLAELIWNSNQPLAMPAAAPAKKATPKAPARKR